MSLGPSSCNFGDGRLSVFGILCRVPFAKADAAPDVSIRVCLMAGFKTENAENLTLFFVDDVWDTIEELEIKEAVRSDATTGRTRRPSRRIRG